MKRLLLVLVPAGILVLAGAFLARPQAAPPVLAREPVPDHTTQARLKMCEKGAVENDKKLAEISSAFSSMKSVLEEFALNSLKQPEPAAQQSEPLTPERKQVPRLLSVSIQQRAPVKISIPAGTHGHVAIENGMFAPVSGEVVPGVARLSGNFAAPSGKTISWISDAHIVLKCQGDANSSRALCQAVTVSIVTRDGKSVSAQCNGFVTDSDETLGLSGKYVFNAHDLVLLSALSSIAGSTAQIANQVYVVKSIAEEKVQVLPLAASSAVGGVANGIEKIAEKRISEFTPSIFVEPGKEGEFFFIEQVDLDVNVKEVPNEIDDSGYSGLDAVK